jgi:putative SOS response-associated peptidase YedK
MGTTMCSRICLSRGVDEIRRRFAVRGGSPRLKPRWNIGAGTLLPAIRLEGASQLRRLDMMHWGLVIGWSQNARIVRTNFHVVELGELKSRLFHRCLVPAENFYEWRSADKQPFAVALKSRQVMALAGVWDYWFSPAGEQLACFALLTTDSNSVLAPLCKRMPVLVKPEDWDTWLSPGPAPEGLEQLIRAGAEEELEIWPVGRAVSNLRNDNPGLVARVG